jgi:hypothetical protein
MKTYMWEKRLLIQYGSDESPSIEEIYQAFKKRLMDEVVPGLALVGVGHSEGILMPKPKPEPTDEEMHTAFKESEALFPNDITRQKADYDNRMRKLRG